MSMNMITKKSKTGVREKNRVGMERGGLSRLQRTVISHLVATENARCPLSLSLFLGALWTKSVQGLQITLDSP